MTFYCMNWNGIRDKVNSWFCCYLTTVVKQHKSAHIILKMRLVPVLSHKALFCTLCCFCYTLMIFLICLINFVSFCLAMVLNTLIFRPHQDRKCLRSYSQNVYLKYEGMFTNRDNLVYYKVRWRVISNWDSFCITKCDDY